MKFRSVRSVAFALSAVLTAPAFAQDAPFSIGLWGDMPYARSNDGPKIPNLVQDMNASDIAFSIYIGDIKDGSSQCTDDVFPAAIAMFNSLNKPVLYTPGDNEWTDCHRTNNGGFNALERLGHLRQVMVPTMESFGQEKLMLERQAAPGEPMSENFRLVRGGVVFVGINVPGSNNGKVSDDATCTNKSARTLADCAATNAAFEERDGANIAWLREAFVAAKASGAKGVLVAIQGDPGFDVPETEGTNERVAGDHDGFDAFVEALMTEAVAYDGQVALIHGDTHYFKIDKPLRDYSDMIANITRVETFGSPNIHWVRATIDPSSRDVFDFEPMIVPANAKAQPTN